MIQKANADIYELAKSKHLRLWWIAYELKMQDSNFTKLLRKPLTLDKRQQVLQAIDKLVVERG